MCHRKSKLRKPDEVALGPQYAGSRISRIALLNEDDEIDEKDSDEEYEDTVEAMEGVFANPEDIDPDAAEEDGDIDSEKAFGESDDEKFKGFTFRGSGKPREVNGNKRRPTAADFMSDSDEDDAGRNKNVSEADETDEDILEVDAQHAEGTKDDSEGSAEDEGSGEDRQDESDESALDDDDNEMDDASDNGSEDEDAEKARRAELRRIMNEEQKTVVAIISKAAKADAEKGNAVLQQRKAFDSLLSVRIAMQKGLVAANSMAVLEEQDSEDIPDEPYQAAEDAAIRLWNTLDGIRQEVIKASGVQTGQKRKRGINSSTSSSVIWERMQDSELATLDNRQTTLEKWSNKVKDTTALPLSRKLNSAQPQSKLASLQDQVAKKTQEHGGSVTFDDTKFYKILLNNFVDQRRMDAVPATGSPNGGPAQFAVVKEAKMRKKVDTKASKGRKMRFTVHEKLQNFMAPEDRGSWEPEAIDRFFGTLLGQKMSLGEDMEVEDEDEIPLEEQGLMLFRS